MSISRHVYVYFNNQGIMTTQIPHGSGNIRQGDTFDLYVLFDVDNDLQDKILSVQFKKPGELEFGNEYYFDSMGVTPFKKINNNEITYDLIDGREYFTCILHVKRSMDVTSKFGNIEALVTIYDLNIVGETDEDYVEVKDVYSTGLVHIHIEKTYGKTRSISGIDQTQYDYLIARIGVAIADFSTRTEAIEERIGYVEGMLDELNGEVV